MQRAPEPTLPGPLAPWLAWCYAALIVYASLYPFSGWHDQGIVPWAYLQAPWPRYWTGFDLVTNFLGYLPLGFLLTVVLARTRRLSVAMLLASGGGLLLSLTMESLQSYLPLRVASNVDFALNATGAAAGSLLAALLWQLGLLQRWRRLHRRWFTRHARGGLLLLALWPVGLLAPLPVAYGMGQVLEHLESALGALLRGTPYLELLPLRPFELEPLLPWAEILCIALGALAPCLLGYFAVRNRRLRLILAPLILLAGMLALTLHTAMSYGPGHTLLWLTPMVRAGLLLGAGLAAVLAWLPLSRPRYLLLLAVALLVQLFLLNGASQSAYFASELQNWAQGRFIHFYGLTQWVAWLWPFTTLAYLARRLLHRIPA